MYREIVRCITDEDWAGASRELAAVLDKYGFNDEIAALAATIYIGIGDISKARETITKGLKMNNRNCELWLLLGQSYEAFNVNQAYLCYENALFYCKDEADAAIVKKYMFHAALSESFCVKKSAIIILSYNSLPFTRACIESIRINCAASAYELIVIDNASTDESVAWLMEQTDIKLQCNSENAGFPGGCNQGIELAEPDSDIFLLNNDTIMAENSLFWLRMGLYEDKQTGAVGAMSNAVSNLQQVTWNCNSVEEYLKAACMNNLPMERPYLQKNWLIGFALLIKRSCLDEIGALDERFTPGQYEDNDIGLRLNKAGYRLFLCRNSFIFHFGSGGGKNIEKWSRLLEENRIKIQEKWGFEFDEYILIDLELLGRVVSSGETPKSILQIGCGIGATLLALKDEYPDAKICGIETNENMIDVTPDNVDVYHCDILREDAPFEKESFDIVISGKAYDSASDQAVFTAKAMEYLKAGGRFITHGTSVLKQNGGKAETENETFPLVSILMPCYNHGAYVANAIESVLNQTYPNIEVIVADNGCTDDSFEVISRYKDKIKILRMDKNNQEVCWRLLCDAAAGEYIAFATSDDEWDPRKIESQMEAFFAIPNLLVCFTWGVYANENMQVLPDQKNNVFLAENRSREEWLKRFIFSGNCLCFPSAVLKKELYKYFMGISRGYIQLGDFYLWIKAVQMGEIYIVEKPMVKFRWHVDGDNRNSSAPSVENSIRVGQEYAEIILQVFETVEDDFFRNAFRKEFIKQEAKSHQELLCEKFFLLKKMAEASYNHSEVMLHFYHNHYVEMERVLEKEYGFHAADFAGLAAKSGLSKACMDMNKSMSAIAELREYIQAYMNIAQKMADNVYAGGQFICDKASAIYCMMPEQDKTNVKDLYRLSNSILRIITQDSISDAELYHKSIGFLVELCRLMERLQAQLKILGILNDNETFELFCELIHLGEEKRIDFQEAVIPYIQLISEQLNGVITDK